MFFYYISLILISYQCKHSNISNKKVHKRLHNTKQINKTADKYFSLFGNFTKSSFETSKKTTGVAIFLEKQAIRNWRENCF